MRRASRRAVLGFLIASLVLPAQAIAIVDTTAPVGTLAAAAYDTTGNLLRLDVAATDDISGVATVEVSGNGTTWASFPYAAQVDWALFDTAAGGAAGLGDRTVRVRWTDVAGNTSVVKTTRVWVNAYVGLELPVAPVTGQPFTIRPLYPPGAVIPADWDCGWELRWGDTASLRDNSFNATFGSLFLSGKPDRGFCGQWTFTVPHVPVAQFEIYFNGPFGAAGDEPWSGPRFYPTGSSTDRRIHASNLPLVQVLPDTYQMIVGQPITYRAYFIGTTLRSTDTWMAVQLGRPFIGPRYGTSTFTFTPPTTGNWLVTFNGPQGRPFTVGATYDPKARRRDSTPPNTTAPVQRIAIGTPGATVPVRLDWSGSDVGWGIAGFRLQRSVNGGTWQSVALPLAKSTSIVVHLTAGRHYRFRVRAVDGAGNFGSWDYGPTFTPRVVGDGATAVTYGGPAWTVEADATALGGSLHRADTAGAGARLQFVGRDVAWVAEKGPGKGQARVYVDGVLIETVNLWAASDTAKSIVFRRHWTTVGTHVVRIVVVGTVAHPTVTLDGFAILR